MGDRRTLVQGAYCELNRDNRPRIAVAMAVSSYGGGSKPRKKVAPMRLFFALRESFGVGKKRNALRLGKIGPNGLFWGHFWSIFFSVGSHYLWCEEEMRVMRQCTYPGAPF